MPKKDLKIKRGTCILTEEPFCYILKSKFRKERCDYCLQQGHVKKCSNCEYAYYCNRFCQVNAWPIHKVECPFLKKIAPRDVPDAARMLHRIILRLQNGGDLIKGYYTETCSRKFRDLMSHYAEIKNDAKRLEHIESLESVLIDLLGNNLMPNHTELLGIYGRLITNGFNILDPEMNSVGTGIYLGVSVTDHSCTPNAVATFEGTTLKIRLTKDIPCLDWSKIFISYIDLLDTAVQRRQTLMENYYFLCTCSKCIDEQEMLEMVSPACQNKKCSGFVSLSKNECQVCKRIITKDFIKQYEEVMEFTKNHLENMKEIAYLDVCKICLDKQNNVLHQLNLWRIKTLDSAFESAIEFNKWADAIEFGSQLVPGFKKYYGECHPLLGMLYTKLGKIQLYERYPKIALRNFEEARKILEITHGADHSIFRQQLRPLILQASLENNET
ncbi:histone-lysine N-methyltransferase SMYD3 isoform X2 [Condylostylus longicornis]|nr:histone-lysine N-methyltransferase SMYD3 isoform X2 [Condylostylus longicornis]XP_055380487.1 histone-lysine N-methyltransferase SMYD3 isoform X2 [Condylostylus longicornis]